MTEAEEYTLQEQYIAMMKRMEDEGGAIIGWFGFDAMLGRAGVWSHSYVRRYAPHH